MENNKENERIPVTILTGFLGAGKTTLLNQLIRENPGKKIAVIENEFGEINIDSDLVVGVEDGIFELSSGCVCCELNDELITVLQKLIKTHPGIHHLVVETTGIADPAPVAMSFLADETIQSAFRLDAVITLVDARFIEQQLEDQEEACKQVAIADVVLVNKTDKVDAYQKETVTNIVKRMNNQALIRESAFGKVEGIDLLNLKAFSRENILNAKIETPSLGGLSFNAFSSPLEKSPALNPNQKTQLHSDISSCSFVFPEPLDLLKFDIWMRMLLNDVAFKIYRVKGILNFKDYKEKLVFQSVNNQYVSESAGNWGNEERISKIVFIGKKIKKEILAQGMAICCSDKPYEPSEFLKLFFTSDLV